MHRFLLIIFILQFDMKFSFGDSCSIVIDGCGLSKGARRSYYMLSNRENRIKIYFSPMDCIRNNYTYSWSAQPRGKGNKETSETKSPIWMANIKSDSDYDLYDIVVKLVGDGKEGGSLQAECSVWVRPPRNQLHIDVRAYKVIRSTWTSRAVRREEIKKTFYYQRFVGKTCSIGDKSKATFSMPSNRFYGCDETSDRYTALTGNNTWNFVYNRDVLDMDVYQTEECRIAFAMNQVDRLPATEWIYTHQMYYTSELNAYKENEPQYLHNQYCLKNCACPRQNYQDDSRIHIIAGDDRTDRYLNYTYYPPKEVRDYMWIPKLEDAKFYPLFYYDSSYKVQQVSMYRSHTAFLFRSVHYPTRLSCRYRKEVENMVAMKHYIEFYCLPSDSISSPHELKYRLEQKIDEVWTPLSESVFAGGRTRLITNHDSFAKEIAFSVITPWGGIQRQIFYSYVGPYFSTAESYEYLQEEIMKIYSNNNPNIPSPQTLFQLELYDESLALINALLREVVIYRPKDEYEYIIRELHIGDFCSQCLELLLKFDKSIKSLQLARAAVIPQLLHVFGGITYRTKLSKYCKLVVELLIGTAQPFIDGVHAKLENVIPSDFANAYVMIRECAMYVALTQGSERQEEEQQELPSQMFPIHETVRTTKRTEINLASHDTKEYQEQLIEMHKNVRDMIYYMTAVRFRECFFCNIDDELATGHLLHNLVPYKSETRTFQKKSFSSPLIEYSIPTHEFDFSTYAILVILVPPVHPSRLFVNDRKSGFLISSLVTIYGIQARDNKGTFEPLKLNRIDVKFPLRHSPIDLNLLRTEYIYLPPLKLRPNSTDYLILDFEGEKGKLTCIEIYNTSKPLTILPSSTAKPTIGELGMIILPRRKSIYCFPLATGSLRYYLGIKQQIEVKYQKRAVTDNDDLGKAEFSYVVYSISCSRLEKGTNKMIDDESLYITANDMLQCSGDTIEDVALFGLLPPVRLHYPSYHFDRTFTYLFKPEVNWMMYLPVLMALFLFCMFWMLLIYSYTYPQAVYFLGDNHKDERYAYLIEVNTSKEFESGTTSNIGIKVFGKEGASRAHVLNYPDPDSRLLRTNTINYFIMTTNSHLGHLKRIIIWTDFISLQPKWNCNYIRICDLQTKTWWVFNVNGWLTLERKNRHCLKVNVSRTLYVPYRWYSVLMVTFNCKHNWNIMTSYSRFYGCGEKLTVVFSQILCVCSFVIIICINPSIKPFDARELERIEEGYVTGVTCAASLAAFLLNVPFIILFRSSNLTRKDLYNYQPNVLSKVIRYMTWIGISMVILANFLYIFIYSVYISYLTAWKMYGLIIVSLFWIIFFWEVLFIVCTNLYNRKKGSVIIKKYYYNRIIAEGEEQRAMLSRICNNAANLRPYLAHLYKPLGVDVLAVKRRVIARRMIVGRYFRYVSFLLLCFILIHIIATVNDDKLIAWHNAHLREMLAGETPVKQKKDTTLYDIDRLSRIRDYIGDILVDTLNSRQWYGEYKVVDSQLSSDFHTKYIGRIVLRLIGVKSSRPQNHNLAQGLANLTRVYPEFSDSLMDSDELNNDWPFYPAHVNGRTPIMGKVSSYPGDGFFQEITMTAEEFLNSTSENVKEVWEEDFVRALVIEFLMYNHNINVYSSVRILIEKSATGLIIPTMIIKSARLYIRDPIPNLIIRVAFYFLIIVLVLYVLITVRNAMISRTTFHSRLHVFDVVLLIGFFVIMGYILAKNAEINRVLPDLRFDTVVKFRKYYQTFDFIQQYRDTIGIVLWLLVIAICIYLKFVTSDIGCFKIIRTTAFLGLVMELVFFGISFSISGHIMYNFKGSFQTFGTVLNRIFMLRALRFAADTRRILLYTQFYPVYFIVYAMFLFYIWVLFAAYIMRRYREQNEYAKFWWFEQYSIWNYFTDHISFYSQYVHKRFKSIKQAAGRAKECEEIFFRANKHRFCGCFSTRESILESIRHIVFGYLYIKYLREDRPLNHRDVTVMLGIAESYMKRTESVEMIYYRDCRHGKRHFMMERRMAIMAIVVDRILQKKIVHEKTDTAEGNEDEIIPDMLTDRRLDEIIYQLNAIEETLQRLANL